MTEHRSPLYFALRRFADNKAAVVSSLILSVIVLMALFAPLITPTGYADQAYLTNALAFPSAEHWMGVDDLGRDFFTRIVHGARVSLSIGFAAALFSVLVGIPLEEGLARAVAVHTISPRRHVVVLQQGLNRQIRRMFDSLGFSVERLIRSRIGSLTIENLKPGKWRVLRPDEITRLGQEAGRQPRSKPTRRPSRANPDDPPTKVH